jgi:hypothetical protein
MGEQQAPTRWGGILVPAVAWLLLIAGFLVLVFSFTPTG